MLATETIEIRLNMSVIALLAELRGVGKISWFAVLPEKQIVREGYVLSTSCRPYKAKPLPRQPFTALKSVFKMCSRLANRTDIKTKGEDKKTA